MTPEDLASALARASSPGSDKPVIRYAGPVPPAGLRWKVHRCGHEPLTLVHPVVIGEVVAAAQRAGAAAGARVARAATGPAATGPAATDPGGGVAPPADERTARLARLHAELGRELRRAAAMGIGRMGIGRTAPADAPLTAADLDVAAALLEAPAAFSRGGRPMHRHTVVLADALDAWLATVCVTPRTVDEPVGPHHETRCALAAAARRLLAEMLAAKGVPAPERR